MNRPTNKALQEVRVLGGFGLGVVLNIVQPDIQSLGGNGRSYHPPSHIKAFSGISVGLHSCIGSLGHYLEASEEEVLAAIVA